MRKVLVTLALAAGSACGRSPVGPDTSPDPAGFDIGSACFELRLGGTPAPDVKLPRLIELTREPAPGFVEPGRFAVREPTGVPRAPLSWWMPKGDSTLDLVLGGGYTGYAFSLERKGRGWAGEGTYFADFGVEPSPLPLPLYLSPRACS
jgi:hypothetical protein